MTGNSQPVRSERTRDLTPDRLATGLGWFGIGLGLAELTAPRTIARLIGLDGADASRTERVLRGFGLREIASGFGIVGSARPSPWLWSRVAGDLIDLAYLGSHYEGRRIVKSRVSAATVAVAAVTVLDVIASRRTTHGATNGATAPQVEAAPAVITINRSAEEVYRFWRRLENLPRFMTHLRSVAATGERTSHWTVEALGTTVEWDAEITDDVPGERIAWRAVEDADVPNEGVVTFAAAPGGRGTEVRVEIDYAPPAGKIGKAFAALLGVEPGQTAQQELRRLKQLLETGEIPTTDGQPHGARSLLGKALAPLEQRSAS